MTTIRRQIKNVVKNYSEAEVKVREATSNDPWGPSSTLMSEIADLTYNIVALGEIMRMIWKRLNDHGKNWRHVYKSLVLLDYLIKNGNEKVAQQCKEHIVAIQTLKDFQYIEENKDQGASVRDKAKQLVSLLREDERLKQERIKAHKARERYSQNAMGISSDNKITYIQNNRAGGSMMGVSLKTGGNYYDPYGGAQATASSLATSSSLSPDLEAVRPSDVTEEELQVNLALALSQQEHEEEIKRKRADEAKLQIAIEQSRLESDTNSNNDGLLDFSSTNDFSVKMDTHATAPSLLNDPWSSIDTVKLPQPPSSTANATHKINNNNLFPSLPQTNNDPWLLSSSSSTNSTVTNSTNNKNILQQQLDDPWATNTTIVETKPSNGTSTTTTNPWNTSPQVSNDPWSPSPVPTVSNSNGFDDLFSKPIQQTPQPTVVDPFGDLFSSSNEPTKAPLVSPTNPWSNDTTTPKPLITHSTSNEIKQLTRKTPESFLGETASLVNLDNLIPSTRPKSTNPFGSGPAITATSATINTSKPIVPSTSSTINPFAQQTQKPPSINQLANQNNFSTMPTATNYGNFNSANGFFTQTNITPPLIPQTTNHTPAAASTNPFLMM